MRKFNIIIFLIFSVVGFCQSQDLVYRPVNPAFGGDTFNYQWLLSSAQAQNLIEDPAFADTEEDNTLDQFAESLNRQLLNQLSLQLVTNQFGENGLEEGSFTLGDFQVDVSNNLEGLVINIFDIVAGESTQVIIPHF